MSNHFKSVGLFCWAAWCAFSRPCRPVLQFFSGIFNFFPLFSECFPFPRSQFPIGCGFLQLPAKWELHALSFLSPLCECVAGSQIGHLLCKDCKFLIHVRRCHTIRITRKTSPPCVPAGKTVQWTIFRAQVPPRPDWPEKGLYHPLRGWLMRRASACIRLAGTGR